MTSQRQNIEKLISIYVRKYTSTHIMQKRTQPYSYTIYTLPCLTVWGLITGGLVKFV